MPFGRQSRNIIWFQKDSVSRFQLAKDQFSRPQIVGLVTGEDSEVQQFLFEENMLLFSQTVKENERKEKLRRINKSPTNDKNLKKRFGYGTFNRGWDGHVIRTGGCNRTTSIVNLIAIRIHSPQLEAFLAMPLPKILSKASNASRDALHVPTGDFNLSATLGTCEFLNSTEGGQQAIEFELPRTRHFNIPSNRA